MLAEKIMQIEIKDEVKKILLSMGSDITYGARSLKRTIQIHLRNPLSTELLLNNFPHGDTIVVSYPKDNLQDYEAAVK